MNPRCSRSREPGQLSSMGALPRSRKYPMRIKWLCARISIVSTGSNVHQNLMSSQFELFSRRNVLVSTAQTARFEIYQFSKRKSTITFKLTGPVVMLYICMTYIDRVIYWKGVHHGQDL